MAFGFLSQSLIDAGDLHSHLPDQTSGILHTDIQLLRILGSIIGNLIYHGVEHLAGTVAIFNRDNSGEGMFRVVDDFQITGGVPRETVQLVTQVDEQVIPSVRQCINLVGRSDDGLQLRIVLAKAVGLVQSGQDFVTMCVILAQIVRQLPIVAVIVDVVLLIIQVIQVKKL